MVAMLGAQQCLLTVTAVIVLPKAKVGALFNACQTAQQSVIDRSPQQPVKTEVEKTPTLQEKLKATEQLKNGKGIDGIPAEIWKNGEPALNIKLHEFFVCYWEQGKLPQVLRDAVIITLYKNKREKSECSNYRRINLLFIVGKIVARVLLNRTHYCRRTPPKEPMWFQGQSVNH